MDEHLFKWDKVRCEEVTEKDKKRITDFIIHNYCPKLSLTAKTGITDGKTIKVADEKSTVFLILESNKGKLNIKIAEKIDELVVIKMDIYIKNSKESTVYPTVSTQGPGNRFVGYTGIVLILVYLLLFSVVIICNLAQFWPRPVFTSENAKHLVVVSNDGYTHAQAFTDGKANSSNSPVSPVTFFRWTFPLSDEERLFLIVALAGALGSLVHALRSFYWCVGNRELVFRWLGFVVISALVSLFSIPAALKLRDIVETVFAKAGKGRSQNRR